MTKVCEKCGVEFEGKQAHFCPVCRKDVQREAALEYYHKNRTEIRQKQKEYHGTESYRKRYEEYYAKNRERLVAKQKAYNAAKGHKPREYAKDISGWTIEFIRHGDLWTWKAKRGASELKAARDFSTLRLAQKDCLLALG